MSKTSTLGQKIGKALLIILMVFVLLCAAVLGFAYLGKQRTYDLALTGANAQGMADGTYTGAYAAFRFSNTVAVTVKGQTIADITVIKPQVVAKNATMQALRAEVLKAQTTDVDIVAGATVDSKAYLKAVENALTGGR